jgi:hypothetical protein
VNTGHLYYVIGAEMSLLTAHPSYEIILLSRVKGAGAAIDNWEHEIWMNIMLVQWKGDFAERIAVGQLKSLKNQRRLADAVYLNSLPNWKTIRLI